MPNARHPRWRIDGDELVTQITPGNFQQGLLLLNAIGYLAEKHQHHPVLTLGYNRLEIRLTTHDANALTIKDDHLA
ncbi:MAG: 4a-hydroxytetrahydrobiopterin dehydratase, partial [Halothiobacillus sp.]